VSLFRHGLSFYRMYVDPTMYANMVLSQLSEDTEIAGHRDAHRQV
jgi:hypothetical protein